MEDDVITIEFGDLFAYNLNINFQSKKTFIEFGEIITEKSKPTKRILFHEIVWQEFSEFDLTNIFNTIEIDHDFDLFYKKHIDYFQRMKNYISEHKMSEIKSEKNIYYTFLQTYGFNCFVIVQQEIEIQVID